ncbi:MAG TPA: hypothetical protein VGQ17_07540 [Gemmatimonadales bacterium]|jgi:hypothetical protein|nr:hypothetical protein [Gemmatimonadales bacterium]
MKTLIRCGALTCAVVLGACSKDSTGPTDQQLPFLAADLAQAAADGIGEDVDVMREPVFFAFMPFFAPGALGAVGSGPGPVFELGRGDFHPLNCPFDAASGRLVCPTISHDGITINRSYAFWDAANAVQQAYDATTTAKANLQTSFVGTRSGEFWSGSVDRGKDLTATGLAGAETQRTWNGTGHDKVTRSRSTEGGETRTYNLDCSVTIQDVVVPVPSGDGGPHFPLSGTITRSCTVTIVGGPHDGTTIQRTVVVTFHGTATATLTIGDRTFDIDLSTRHRFPRP